ncbi:HEPN domain-containing protein [Microbacterium sp.]|uniref:HEPN domain-containing protein n=1 Tax=Microbacterium sp. TaxID=51671 RepID=UPI0028AB4FF3|nr:HEPN domain-containing protein [Microbacterium sp.]
MSALSDHLDRLNEVGVLLRHVAPEVEPDVEVGADRRPFSDSTFARSCLVLSVSYFEGFLKDLSDEAFDAILASKIACDRLSTHLRGHAIGSHVHTLRQSEDPSAQWSALTALIEFGVQLNTGSSVSEAMIPREEVKRAVTSIEPQKINVLFRSLGDEDLNTGPMSVFGTRLNNLKRIRDNAVHGNEKDLEPLSLRDADDCVKLLRDCAHSMNNRTTALLGKLGVTKDI